MSGGAEGIEPLSNLPPPSAMAAVIRELLLPIVSSVIEDWSLALFLRIGKWLEANHAGRTVMVVVGMLLGLAAFFFVPVVCGILGF